MEQGRPTDFCKEIADRICLSLSEGRSLRAVCCDENMPHISTVLRWVQKHESFREQYARARETQAEVWADELVNIADDSSNDVREVEKNGQLVEIVDHDHINRSRLRVDTRKWVLSKILPKKYGEKVSMDISNPDGSLGGMKISVNFVAPEMIAAPLKQIEAGSGDVLEGEVVDAD